MRSVQKGSGIRILQVLQRRSRRAARSLLRLPMNMPPCVGLGRQRGGTEHRWLDWEAGAAARFYEGEAQELFSYNAGAFQGSRFSGGRSFVGGLYAEGASRFDGFLVTAGLRLD